MRLPSRRIMSSKRARQVVWLITFQIGSMSGSSPVELDQLGAELAQLAERRARRPTRTSFDTKRLPSVRL